MRGITLCLVIAGCSTASLNTRGTQVELLHAPPSGRCESLGTVTGTGGGYAGAWVSNPQLIEYAQNDLRNAAGERGATHVHAQPPALGAGQGTTTTATITGTAYACDEGPLVQTSPARPAPTPRPVLLATEENVASERRSPEQEAPHPSAAARDLERRIRALLDAHRDDILACIAEERTALRVRVAAGVMEIRIHGPMGGSPEEACVQSLFAPNVFENALADHEVVHVVR
ncbi:MAG: DUF4156 domain-containing protein [Myxococcota bacterium]